MAGPRPETGEAGLLSEAVEEIRLKAAEDARRRRELAARRQAIRRVDYWLNDVESMLEEDQRTVPEPLVREIAVFLRSVDPKLQRSLLRNRAREASRVLDVLFDAQEALLPRAAESVA
jgi:hypothetical protein